MRQTTTICATIVVTLLLQACRAQPVANVSLKVRIPQSIADDVPRDEVSTVMQVGLKRETALLSGLDSFVPPQDLIEEQAEPLRVTLMVGDDPRALENTSFLGRAGDVLLEAFADVTETLNYERSVVLSSTNTVVNLFEALPASVAGPGQVAACFDDAGNAAFVGGEGRAYLFSASELTSSEALQILGSEDGANAACAMVASAPTTTVNAELSERSGDVVAVTCDGVLNASLHVSTASTTHTTRLSAAECSPKVAVVDDDIFVVREATVNVFSFADVRTDDDVNMIAEGTLPDATATDVIAFQDGGILVARDGIPQHVTRDGSVVTATDVGTRQYARFVKGKGDVLGLIDTGAATEVRNVATGALEHTINATAVLDAVVANGTVVALTSDNVYVQGLANPIPVVAGNNRTELAVTVGGAVLLFGGGDGVDVLVFAVPVE